MSEVPRIVPLRLQKFLARAGVASRRGSENLMTAGRVTVNAQVVTELGTKVDPLKDEIRVDGKLVSLEASPVTLILYKPAGVLTTMSDPYHRPSVASLVPRDTYPGLFPIGRLDRDTTGLLLFSTDGELGNRLLHPRHHVLKRYLALVEGLPTDKELERLKAGVQLDDGPTQKAHLRLLRGKEEHKAKALLAPSQQCFEASFGQRKSAAWKDLPRHVVEIGLYEGRKHQVKRMLAAVGHPVCALHRVSFGPIELRDLPYGKTRLLNEAELASLYEASGSS